MNGSLRKVAAFVALMFGALLLNFTHFSVFRTAPLLEHPRNVRVRDAEFSQDRGAILVGNTPIALTSTSTGSRFKYQRTYPHGALYGHITGFYSYNFDRVGLEKTYNSQLAGTDSSQAFTRFLDLLSGRKPTGASVVTTIDSRAQRAAAEAIGDRRGAVIAMDYTTGEIVAMYSSPSYDPNLLSSHDHRAELDNWNKLLKDPSEPLKNRSSTEIFPPGSTFKLVTAAAALESGLEANSLLEGPARLQLPGTTHTITNSGPCGDGQISLRDAMISSCNTAFANLGMTLGADTLRAKARQFGFDAELKTDFATAASKFPAKPDKPQTAMSAIGLFEVAASPLQMLQVGAAIANDGVLMEPHLGKQVIAADLSVLSSTSPTELGRPINAKTARTLQDMMRAVVTQGTGKAANSNVVNIHGKTGTAMQPENRPNYAWMVGFSDEPKIVAVAMIEDSASDRSDIAGGRLAGPIVRQVIESVR